jgi:hypothetical protein
VAAVGLRLDVDPRRCLGSGPRAGLHGGR